VTADHDDALAGLDRLLHNKRQLQRVRREILENPHVQELGLRLDHEAIRRFFERFRQGVRYAVDTYGLQTLPASISLRSWHVNENGETEVNVIGYDQFKDSILITDVFVAKRCSCFGDGKYYFDYNLPGYSVTAEDRTVLQALEECYHRFQIKGREMILERTTLPTDAMETEIHDIWRKAILDLGIVVRPRT
jgi:hypothetical protein